jgi:hypothetical protein
MSMTKVALSIAALALLTSLTASPAFAKSKGKNKKPAPVVEVDKTASVTGEKKTDVVHITIQTMPPRKAQVKWGKKNLGEIPVPHPLVIERPRDSGPMDLVIRMNGYLPVHTRAYTFNNSRVAVKLTPPTEKNTLFGYRQEVTPVPEAGAEGEPPPRLTP